MFSFIKDKLNNIYNQFTWKVSTLFKRETLDKNTIQELETLLISTDMGVKITKQVIQKLNDLYQNGEISKGQDLKIALSNILNDILNIDKPILESINQNIYLLVGINGSGKTTFAGKLANKFKNQGKKVLLVAGDTFRAAAVEQLNRWAQKLDIDIEIGNENQDPAAVIFSGCERFKKDNFDILIIDTAGRLQTKVNLMKELEKIKRVISKQLPNQNVSTLLTVDSMLGLNSYEQAKVFNEVINLDGLVLTKMDGTGRAGILFSIVQEFKIPVKYICFGEEVDKVKDFDSQEYIQQLLSE